MPNAYIRLEKDTEFPSHISQLAVKDTSNADLICARMMQH